MSVLQVQVIESLEGLSDESLSFLLNMIEQFMKPQKSISDAKVPSGGIRIGMFRGEKYIADGYDFDEDNTEIAKLFEGAE